MNSTHFLVQFRQLNKLYECMLKEICGRHKLTLIETTIISFLYNNPGRDTAACQWHNKSTHFWRRKIPTFVTS